MAELTDLEIEKQITLMGLMVKYPAAKSIDFDDKQNCYWVEWAGFSSWPLLHPLTDDALCFKLMIEHKVELDFSLGVFTQASVPDFKSGDEDAMLSTVEYWHDDHSHNKAICIAIIEAQT